MVQRQDEHDFVLGWLKRLGLGLARERWHEASVNAASRFVLTLEHDRHEDLHYVAEQLDALERMVKEDAAALRFQ
jgi:hypothetical protein